MIFKRRNMRITSHTRRRNTKYIALANSRHTMATYSNGPLTAPHSRQRVGDKWRLLFLTATGSADRDQTLLALIRYGCSVFRTELRIAPPSIDRQLGSPCSTKEGVWAQRERP